MAKITSLTNLEIRLLNFFIEHIKEEFGIREISRLTKIEYKSIHSTIKKLAKKEVLLKQRRANVDLCSLNLKDDLTSVLFVEMIRKRTFLLKHKNLERFFVNVLEKTKEIYFTLVIFGSFAKDKERKNSDLDLLIIAPARDIAEEIQRIINSEAFLLKRNIQSILLDEKEFISNLSDKKLNVVVEAFKNHIIITGIESFYEGVKKSL